MVKGQESEDINFFDLTRNMYIVLATFCGIALGYCIYRKFIGTRRFDDNYRKTSDADMIGVAESENLELSVNKWYIGWFTFVLNIFGFILGYSTAYQNQLTTCFNLKFGWISEHDQNLN